MAKHPSSSKTNRLSNIMSIVRGNFDFRKSENTPKIRSFGAPELISRKERSKILSGAMQVIPLNQNQHADSSSILQLVQSSVRNIGAERFENRKILQLMPDVEKAARLMIASTFSPNDLAHKNISVSFDVDDITKSQKDNLDEMITDFFQEKLNLKTAAPSWVYQWGYESGATIFAIIPLTSFEAIQKTSFIGTENFRNSIVDPVSQECVFGFSSGESNDTDFKGLESIASYEIEFQKSTLNIERSKDSDSSDKTRELINKIIGQESILLTDNVGVLQAGSRLRKETDKRNKDILNSKYRKPLPAMTLGIEPQSDEEGPVGNPILMRLPPESVTVIHTPGDPTDHHGYLVLLDIYGNPIDAVMNEENSSSKPINYNSNQSSIFSQVYNAYGFTSGAHGSMNKEMMNRVYSQIMIDHLKNRLKGAGHHNVSLGNIDAITRCLFTRFLQEKQTRILYLPKDLVSYMTFEMDQNGYGVSRLDRIKFVLGMKMAIQVSKVLAAIKAAMDKRRIDVKFTENMMEQPEAVFQNIVREWVNKSTMNFSIDPNVIQNQIAEKSVSIKASDVPGLETFDISNEPDTRSSALDFDPSIQEYLDKQAINGLHVPPSTMNSLSEDEFARSVTTTNLFFAMDVSIDQDITKANISDLLRKYARFSEEIQKKILDEIPSLKNRNKTASSSIEDTSEIDDVNTTKNEWIIPDHYTLDSLIDKITINLPRPNVAPSKAQFESLSGMIESISNTVNSLFPDDLIGLDDKLSPVLRLLRAKFVAMNVRTYLEGSGMTNIDIPNSNFTDVLAEIKEFMNGLGNVSAMLEDTMKLKESSSGESDLSTDVEGY